MCSAHWLDTLTRRRHHHHHHHHHISGYCAAAQSRWLSISDVSRFESDWQLTRLFLPMYLLYIRGLYLAALRIEYLGRQ